MLLFFLNNELFLHHWGGKTNVQRLCMGEKIAKSVDAEKWKEIN